MKARDVLIYLAIKYKGDWERIYQDIRKKAPLDIEDMNKTLPTLKTNAVTLVDDDYPSELKKSNMPPFVLFYHGDLSLADKSKDIVAYIGSREPSKYGERMASSIGHDLAEAGKIVINGMARGIDSIAMEAALENGGKCIAVLGSGIDKPYPKRNEGIYYRLKNEGLILSEYPFETEPQRENFLLRNRIVAALARLLVVGEAHEHSGTLRTVSYGLELGREVACLPFHADEGSVCNKFIKDGAYMVEESKDILDILQ